MDNSKLAPIVIFCYNRSDTLHKTIDALSSNYLASASDLIVFSDGPKSAKDAAGVKQVRDYLRTIAGFCSVTIHESSENKGLATSIIDGVSRVFKEHPMAIVMEDDVVSSPNFLHFMNQALAAYRDNKRVFSISGFTVPIRLPYPSDVYFTKRSNSAVWAGWHDRWEPIDWNISDYDKFRADRRLKKQFNRMGSDMCSMLERQMTGKLSSWAIRWCYHQFKYDLFSVYPMVSKTVNIGFDHSDASNTTQRFSRFNTVLDAGLKTTFHFPEQPQTEHRVLKQFLKPYSLVQRVKYKILNLIAA